MKSVFDNAKLLQPEEEDEYFMNQNSCNFCRPVIGPFTQLVKSFRNLLTRKMHLPQLMVTLQMRLFFSVVPGKDRIKEKW